MPLREQVELTFPETASPPRVSLPTAALNVERVSLAPTRFEYAKTGNSHYLALHDIVMRDGEIRVDGIAPIRETDIRRKLTYLPAGFPVSGWTDPLARPNSFVAIHFDVDAIPESMRAAASFRGPSIYFQDRGLADTLGRLDRAMTRNDPFIELLVESLCDLAIVEFGLWRSKSPVEGRRTPALAPAQVARVRAYMRENLAASVSLTDLSGVAGLSKFHFARAFKAATGRSPYREVLDLRLAEARRRLAAGEGQAAVAALTGFTTTAQLARSLRQHPVEAAVDA